MHKIFAKTLFLGKNLIFLPQCHSTNEEVKRFSKSAHFPEGSVIWTDFQEKGRGQQGNAWMSEPGKNLLFSLYLRPKQLLPADQFELTIVSSLAIQKVLQELVPDRKVEIKWPNDIYCNERKVCGILIETSIAQGHIDQVFCGIGLNVNQSHFRFPTATSLKIETGKDWDRSVILEKILLSMEKFLHHLKDPDHDLWDTYNSVLRWKGEEHVFRINAEEVSACIVGVSPTGELVVNLAGNLNTYKLKEISFVH